MIKVLQGTISYPEVKWGKPEDRAKNTPLADFIEDLKDVGADGIELWGRHLERLDEKGVKALAKRIKDTGQKVVALGAYWDFSSSDEAVETSLEEAWKYLTYVDLFGAKKIRVFAGAPASKDATEKNWTRAAEGLTRLARMYDDSGIMFVIETHADQLPDTVETAARLMKEVDEPSVRLNYQTMKGDPEVEVEALYKWIEHAHVSPVARFKDPTEAVIRALLKRGYNGTVTVEFCTDSLPAEGETFDRAKAIAGMKKDVAFVKRLRTAGKASGE